MSTTSAWRFRSACGATSRSNWAGNVIRVEAAHTTKALRSADRIAEAIEAVKANLTHDWTLEELATRVGCSASKLLSAFKQQTGAPPHAFLISCRIARAKEMLAAGPQTVASVAATLGFATPQHFAA